MTTDYESFEELLCHRMGLSFTRTPDIEKYPLSLTPESINYLKSVGARRVMKDEISRVVYCFDSEGRFIERFNPSKLEQTTQMTQTIVGVPPIDSPPIPKDLRREL